MNKPNKTNNKLVRIKNIRTINGLHSLPKEFGKELRKLDIEDVLEDETSLHNIVGKIAAMRPNTLTLKQGEHNYIIIDTDVILESFVAMRGGKVLHTSPDIEQCRQVMFNQLVKEYPDRLKTITSYRQIDDQFLSKFSIMHKGNARYYRILQTD